MKPVSSSPWFPSVAACVCLGFAAAHSAAMEPCCILVVDQDNGWPVPLVELRTTHHVRFVTDNAGVIAFDLPELMNRETWFYVEGHGYETPKDGFGYQGVRLTPRPGATLTVKVQRRLPAKRLGRITGAGLLGESQKLDRELNWREQGIMGCDSVQNVVHQGRLFWGWGDTVLPHYPLGRFHMIGATTSTRPLESFEPPLRLRYDYFVDQSGAPRNVAEMPGAGPTWLSGYVSLPDQQGVARLGAAYVKIKPPLTAYEHGLCVWNEQSKVFDHLKTIWRAAGRGDASATSSPSTGSPPGMPQGHPVSWRDEQGDSWMLFGDPFPALKCPAAFEAWSDPKTWQTLQPQQRVTVRGAEGVFVTPHRGAIAWNEYLRKWVTVFTQVNGSPSHLGEIWYAAADSPFGPWRNAVKVVTHSNYSFYNPQLHPEFTDPESPVLLFEATYTKTFSRAKVATPRYDYNQVLYRLDLDEPLP